MRHNDTPTISEREPADEDAAAAHAARVGAGLRGEIDAAGGFLGFERFMEYALYAPGLGYYSGGAQKLGKDGDFITAPELSRLFGACVAVQCAEVMAEMAQPVVLEIGAGSGRLAVDVLMRLESLGVLPVRYLILEVSADLRHRQQHLLERSVPHLKPRVHWLETPPAEDFEGVIIANEVLDALPVARFRWRAGEGGRGREGADAGTVEELGVANGAQGFEWAARPAGAAMFSAVEALRSAAAPGWDDGYESEYCPRLSAWAHAVTAALKRGCVLWFDYGLPRAHYYFAQRRTGTLLCHYRHRAHDDPFLHPGLQDITAWVDFTSLAEAAQAAGFDLAGFTTQAHFLAATGIEHEMQRLAADDDARFARLAGEARQLMLPGEMGERFKAMAWLRGMDMALRGLSLVDLRHSL